MDSPTFEDREFLPAAEATKLYTTLQRFIKGGCKGTAFTQVLYKHVMYMFGHIAHYNCGGFRDTWFGNPYQAASWIDNLRQHQPHPNCPRYEVERTIQRWLKENPSVVEKIHKRAEDYQDEETLAIGAALYEGASADTKAKLRRLMLGSE